MTPRRHLVWFAASLLLALPAPSARAAAVPAPKPPAFAAVAGPDAEFLELSERFELREDGTVVHEHQARLAVNSYLAINRLHGETAVVWDPSSERLDVLVNRTVLPSGEVVEAPANAVVDDLPRAVHRNPLWSHLRRKVLIHTALEPGAVIECGYRVTRSGSRWLEAGVPLRLAQPVRSLEIVVDVPEQVDVSWQIAGGAPTVPEDRISNGRRTIRFRLRDLPAIPDEPGAPPRAEMTPWLWVSTAAAGAAIDELTRRIAAAGPLPEAAAAQVAKAVAGKASFEERVLTVLETVRESVSLSEGADPELTRFSIAALADVWRTAWAVPLELAVFAAAALDATGVDAAVGLVGDPGRDGAGVAGFVGFDRPVVVYSDRDGCLRLADPLSPLSGGPLEEALRDRSVVTALPRPAGSACGRGAVGWRRSLTAVLSVADEGSIAGEVELSMAGGATPHAALVHDLGAAASSLAAVVPAGKATEIRTPVLSRRAATVVATVTGSLGRPDAAGLLRLDFGEAPRMAGDALPPVPVGDRLAPILLGGPGEETVEARVTLAPGWSVAALPAVVALENTVGSVRVIAETTSRGEVRVFRRLTLTSRVVAAKAAGDVRALLAAWRSPASREVLLRAPVEEGKHPGKAIVGTSVASGGGRS